MKRDGKREAARILVVDDDPGILRALDVELKASGWEVLLAPDVPHALRVFRDEEPDLVLTDLAMPGATGFDLIAQVRKAAKTPILVLSVRSADRDKVRALDLGADDYVTKPFSVDELLARVRAQLRRAREADAAPVLRFPGLTIDLERRAVRQGERDVRLTPTEFAILEHLATHAGRPITIAQLVSRVWRGAPGTTSDAVRVQVGSLRRKLEPDPARPRYLVTEPWVGYRFVAEPLAETAPGR